MHTRFFAIACLGLLTCLLALPARSEGTPATAEAIRALVAGETTDPNVDPAGADLRRFYDSRNGAPAWSDPGKAASLVSILAGAPAHGLEAGVPKSPAANGGGNSAAHDVALTRLALAYA